MGTVRAALWPPAMLQGEGTHQAPQVSETAPTGSLKVEYTSYLLTSPRAASFRHLCSNTILVRPKGRMPADQAAERVKGLQHRTVCISKLSVHAFLIWGNRIHGLRTLSKIDVDFVHIQI